MKSKRLLSIVCVLTGTFIVLLAFDIIESNKQAPDFVIALCGFAFLVAGLMVLLGEKNRWNDLLAAVLCLAFGGVATWASIFSSDDGFSGGLPFVSYETNVMIGRFMFGGGALVCLAMAVWAVKRFLESSK